MLEVQIRDVCASVLHRTLLILLIRVAMSIRCVCFIFGSCGLCYRTNSTILRFCMLGIALRAFSRRGKRSTSELHTSTSNSQETGWMSSPLLVKSFGFVSLGCDLERTSFPKVPLSRRLPLLQICDVVHGSQWKLRCLMKVLGFWRLCLPFLLWLGKQEPRWSNDDTWCSQASSLSMCLKSSRHWWVIQIVKSWKAYFVARCD